MRTNTLFGGWGVLLTAVVLGCTAGSDAGRTEATQTISSALTGPIQNDWEDGTEQGWQPFGGNPTVANSTEQAFTGTRSLKTTGRTATFQGPSINLTTQLSPGVTYRVSTSVRLAAGEAPTTFRVSVMRTPQGGGNAAFDTVVNNTNVTADAWVTVAANYSFATPASGLTLYVESASATASYYIDTFSLTESAPPPLTFDFEDGTTQGWFPFGSPTVANSTDVAFNGTRSLKTTNRTASFMGPGLNVQGQLTKGATYQVTLSVRMVAGQPTSTLQPTVARTPIGGSTQFDNVATAAGVTDQAWSTVTGFYSFSTDNSALTFYVQTQTGNASYYIDAVTIAQVAPPPVIPPPNTTGAASAFESGALEGWFSRFTGGATLANTTADAHSGTRSLLTTNRTGAFQGPAFDVTNVMFNGSRYAVSMWAKLAPGQPTSQLRVSLQRNGGTTSSFHTVVGNTTVTADAWVRLQAPIYDVALGNSSLTLYVESNGGTASFYLDDFSVTFIPAAVAERNIPSVYQALAPFFPVVGAAVIPADILGEPAFLLSKHFNSITSGNDMKWDATEPTEGTFTFTRADAQVSFAKTNNMRVRGHTLVWHNQTPAWVFNDVNGTPMTPTPENRALLIQRMQNHIQAVMTHFGNDVPIWDVVNEPIDPSQPDGYRRSPWFNIIGPQYIEIAFQAARAASPTAKLYINDFDTTNPPKRDFLLAVVRDLRGRGVPLDGVGHQMHHNIEYPPVQTVLDAINLFATTGAEQSVTELDVSIYSGSFPTPFTSYSDIPASRHTQVGYSYRGFIEACKQMQGKVVSITIWGTSDDKSWLTSSTRIDAPLLFDPSLKKKPAYWALVNPLQLPGADLSTTLTAAPTTVPAGQAVAYTVTVANNADTNPQPFEPTDDDLPAANVAMTMTIPSHTGFQSLSAPAGWSCTTPGQNGSGQVRCTIGSLAVGATGQFGLTVVQNDCTQANGLGIVASASVTSTTADPNPAPNNTGSATIVVSNPPPVITANGALDTTVECHTSYTDAGATALDACDGSVLVSSMSNVNVNAVGTYAVSYNASDSAGGQAATVTRTVRVADTTPPQLSVVAGSSMSPPDHGYRTFTVASLVTAATDSCDGTVGAGSVVITQVTSDEPDNGNGDGNTLNDVVIAGNCRSVQLRSERAGPLNGRVYIVTLRLTDASGNSTIKTVKLTVPLDDTSGPAVDDGPSLTVASACH